MGLRKRTSIVVIIKLSTNFIMLCRGIEKTNFNRGHHKTIYKLYYVVPWDWETNFNRGHHKTIYKLYYVVPWDWETNFNRGHHKSTYNFIIYEFTPHPPHFNVEVPVESCRALSVLHRHQHWKGREGKSFLILSEITECQHIMTRIVN